ncbi:uncharacterized protein LOC114962725 [Acropora millepora]|uniref:uncharacterized protein LOC114962725 n=1 Tax=Acropora millepora TaxID=45264 RepID=UPI001CF206A7|nr:uncharacterized protein LOC114962725 [Acropora millepora]
MVAWGCWYAASQVNVSEGKQWIQDNAMKAVASHVLESGEYKDGLIANAVTVSDRHDSLLCPNKFNSRLPSNLPKQQSHHLVEPQDHSTDDTEWLTNNRGEHISIQNSEQVLIVNEQMSTASKVDPYNAAWALGSVIFLCLILGGVSLYTRLCNNSNSDTKFSLMKNRALVEAENVRLFTFIDRYSRRI